MGDQAVQRAFNVTRNIRIRAFIDGDRRCGVRHIQITNPTGDTRRCNGLLHLRRNVHKLRSAVRFHAQRLHGCASSPARGF